MYIFLTSKSLNLYSARLAQSVERKTLNLVVVGSSPTVGIDPLIFSFLNAMLIQGIVTLRSILYPHVNTSTMIGIHLSLFTSQTCAQVHSDRSVLRSTGSLPRIQVH